MRPEILYPLFRPVESLPGIGPRLAKLVERAAGPRVVDLLWHLPTSIVDRRFSPKVADAPDGVVATLTVRVEAHDAPERGKRRPYRVRCHDGTAPLTLVFFHAKRPYLEQLLPVGQTRVVSGRVEHYGGEAQMAHPDHVVAEAQADQIRVVEPLYRSTEGLGQKVLRRAVFAALDLAPDLTEWIDRSLLADRGWPAWRAALTIAHHPESAQDLALTTTARTRLAFDELLANQLAVALVRQRQRRLPGRRTKGDGSLSARLIAALPYKLTAGQERAIAEVAGDMASARRMLRLLQGDVGSGKTAVALLSIAIAVEAGAQAAMMAPTEILARQHFEFLSETLGRQGVTVALLGGRERAAKRAKVLEGLADGSIDVLVGTHALFQQDVAFKDLALAVIDEQHRFGVHQRLQLSSKGRGVDVLVMTATPIPRTLALTSYGDMDVSRLEEKPAGRQPISTRVLPMSRLDDVVTAVRRAVAEGEKVYWVCPMVEESETADLTAATARHAHLHEILGERVALVHGKMKSDEKEAVVNRFRAAPGTPGAADVLVATTVIEVGVDVPDANIIIIEHAERFGLAQLHQLRGRVGRGGKKATCLLLYAPPLGETARARLEVMRETEDGFRIAEEDLRLRGAGEVLGTRQSGLPTFSLADLEIHGDLLPVAQDHARLVVARNPELEGPEGEALRCLLYLFERDQAVRYLRSG